MKHHEKKRSYFLLVGLAVLTCIFMTSIVPVHAEENPGELYAQSAVLMDADSGRILYEKNGYEARAMASTTKIMTCIVALEQGDENAMVKVSETAASQPEVRLGMHVGERYYLTDLCYSLMLESHNDTAVAIGEGIAGSLEAFANRMNQKAKQIGCMDTYFITPNGLDAADAQGVHHTTAADLARIMRYCIQQSRMSARFLEITRTAEYDFSNVEGSREFHCSNHNAFLHMMDGVLSGKTGFTADAGYCYVGALRQDGETYIVALLACGWPSHKSYKWADARRLMEYGLRYYAYQDLTERLCDVENLSVTVERGVPKHADTETQQIHPRVLLQEKPVTFLLGPKDTVKIKKHLKSTIQAPVSKGDKMGDICLLINGEIQETYLLTSDQEIKKIDFQWCLLKILKYINLND